MEKVTISCAHCGGMFQVPINTSSSSGHYESGFQHSSGCMKTTRVRVNSGKIISTKK